MLDSDNAVKSAQTTFMRVTSTLRWVSTNGFRLFVQIWYRRTPMFWIPEGWVPGYVEWILSFPKAPKGSVSINIWGIACRSVITLSGRAIKATYVLATRKPLQKQKPQLFQADAKQEERKKEL
jgi:tail-anchored protein insertion receptor